MSNPEYADKQTVRRDADGRMFDYFKHVSTVASGAILVYAALVEKIFGGAQVAQWKNVTVVVLLAASIVASCLSMMFIAVMPFTKLTEKDRHWIAILMVAATFFVCWWRCCNSIRSVFVLIAFQIGQEFSAPIRQQHSPAKFNFLRQQISRAVRRLPIASLVLETPCFSIEPFVFHSYSGCL
jgi:hypothetical protein